MKILLARLRLIGDVVFTTPAIQALHERFPDAHLTYLVEPAATPVVAHNPLLDEVIVAPRARGVRQLLADLTLGVRLRAERFDLAIDFHGGPRSSLLTLLSGAPRRIGYAIPGRSWMYTDVVERPRALRPRHSVENQWDLLAPLDIPPGTPASHPVRMIADSAAAARVAERLARGRVGADATLVVVHVSAGNPFRRWPLEHFVGLVATIAAADATRRVVVTSGPSEREAATFVIDGARERLGDLAHRVLEGDEWPLDELRALLDRAALYIGGDSGPLHVAATTLAPIVGLYGPTLPVRSGPWRSALLVHEAVEVADLRCRPCDQRVCAPGDFRCLRMISPDDVLAAAARALARTATHRAPSGLDARAPEKIE